MDSAPTITFIQGKLKVLIVPLAIREKFLAEMTDPFDALKSFQQALLRGIIKLQRGDIDPDLYLRVDSPNRKLRLSCAERSRPRMGLHCLVPQPNLPIGFELKTLRFQCVSHGAFRVIR